MRPVLTRVEAHARAVATLDCDVVAVGPFDALFARGPDGPAYASPARPTTDQDGLRSDLAALARLFAERGHRLRVEFALLAWPELPPALEALGLEPEEETPILVCAAAGFRPRPAGDLGVRWVGGSDDPAFIAQVMRQGFEVRGAAPGLTLPGAPVRVAYAELDGRPAGTGCSTPIEGVTELSAISTLPSQRRRGVAIRLTSFLAGAHFAAGGELAWAASPGPHVAALLQTLGFDDAGVRVSWKIP
jgi:hypothetical protein